MKGGERPEDAYEEGNVGGHVSEKTLMSNTKKHRSWKALTLFGGASVMLGTIIGAPASTSAAVRTTARVAAVCLPEGAQAESFAGSINSLGEDSYPDTFAGSFFTGCPGQLTVAVVPTALDAGAFLNAVTSADAGGVLYTVVDVPNSWATLTASTNVLSSVSWTNLEATGLNIRGFGPDPNNDTVAVTLESPTAENLAAIDSEASALGISHSPATASTYPGVATEVLTELYGGDFSVAGSYGLPLTLDINRFTDVSPFFGGDQIYTSSNGGVLCTGGFPVVGNSSGKDFMVTAGHCGTTTSGWYLSGSQGGTGDGTKLGATSTNYWQDSQHDDFQSIQSGSDDALVWINGGQSARSWGPFCPPLGAR